ncbi:MAG TPA: DUF839 domain-containing protein, partial [Nitrosomonas sp.]|nr:DUF839 domain-containing protein [Nitrosomonas sp.]
MSSKLHPDGKLNPSHTSSNDSANGSILEIIEERRLNRREFLKSSASATAGAAALTVMGTATMGHAEAAKKQTTNIADTIGFTAVSANTVPMTDGVTVPAGYTARVLVSWGDSLTMKPHWDSAGAMDEETQLHCYGAHTDGMHYFPMPGPL